MHLLIAGSLVRWWPALQRRARKQSGANRYLGNAVVWCEHRLRGFALHRLLGNQAEPWAVTHIRSGRRIFAARDSWLATRAVDFLGAKFDGHVDESSLVHRFHSASSGEAVSLDTFQVWLELQLQAWRPVEHDYTRRVWGHDFAIVDLDFERMDADDRVRMTGWGLGIEAGHFLVLPNSGATTRYLVTSVKYESDPRDMWSVDALFAPRGVVPDGVVH